MNTVIIIVISLFLVIINISKKIYKMRQLRYTGNLKLAKQSKFNDFIIRYYTS